MLVQSYSTDWKRIFCGRVSSVSEICAIKWILLPAAVGLEKFGEELSE